MSGQPNPSIYRQEAVDHRNSAQEDGDVLHIAPEWTRWTYWTLLGALLAGGVYCILGTLHEYASGSAIVRFEGKTELTSHNTGLVSSVEVQPGEKVRAGQRLVTFTSAEEVASIERLRHEHELALVRYLRELSDDSARQALSSVRASMELAEAQLETRALRAPHDGIVTDVRVKAGHFLTPGVSVLSIIPEDAAPLLLALFPGSWRPQLLPGMTMRIELDGFRYEYQDVVIEQVGDQIIGPTEARRYLGPELSDALKLEGSIVLVRARLPARTFVRDGRTFTFFDGMPVRAEARVRTESILLTLVPGIKELLPHGT
ncbi:HlyD family efflux transporter periplasmic adaptor subunit [Corallococcus sp. ZKHCc1 1396]|uniref:HlyD family efflux transporter periplasmic adaptor subunit n=1 Tax=Corallococcus soli TaxID=2710757 RepID=A0ABR9PNN8_9BACT|nr:HlyD family efflux transporter periplasmic adaptor subunit [Corallococcus soli]MBE4749489.1 HlyD family efflux transporter periplasmic adaptor subunit [Corallococcus soli]